MTDVLVPSGDDTVHPHDHTHDTHDGPGRTTADGCEPRPSRYALDDRYRHDHGTVLMSGVQALARIPLEQLRVDRNAGLRTAAYVSGYPGSPLAGFDGEAARAAAAATADGMRFVARPGLNEELAATSVMGSQLAMEIDGDRSDYDGVVGVWYAKAPGLDRANDAIRHAVYAGTHRNGGVLALIGDDPGAKSSTLPSSSDATMVDLHMPLLYPGDIQDALDLGRHGIALSRACGLWTGMKVVAGLADGTGTVDLDLDRVQPKKPVFLVNGTPWVPHPFGRLLTPATLELEREFQEIRLEVAKQYAVENELNTISVNPPDAWIGIAACGYTYRQLREALRLLGLPDDRAIADAGIRLLHLRMPLPLDPAIIRRFAVGLREVLVVEEKNPTLEWLVKDALYGGPDQPLIVGKRDESGAKLMPGTGHLDTDAIVEPLRRRLAPVLGDRLAPLPRGGRPLIPLSLGRTPYFCSGCPHNWGTKVPDDALVGAGIGCHGMTALLPEDRVGRMGGLSAMGNEGAQWVGMSPFVNDPHFIQNIGDGTYFHSGQLAIRFAIAANVNITYKILYNGTVAMTGGQDAQGAVSVPDLARILLLEGVKQVVVTTDDPSKYAHESSARRAYARIGLGGSRRASHGARARQAKPMLPKGVQVRNRTEIVQVQEELAKVPGVTVLIHDQYCAAEKRRDRKRGKLATPATRVVINERICEGCGNCGDVSNCLSVQPVDTEYGRKTRIHQTSCNLDYSCVQGDCPSFALVTPAAGRKKAATSSGAGTSAAVGSSAGSASASGAGSASASGVGLTGPSDVDAVDVADLPEPTRIVPVDDCTVRMPGIGGTGVVTVSQILATAALLEGSTARGLDQTGLSQKAGPVVSDVRISRSGAHDSNKATDGSVDCLLAFDLLVSSSDANLAGCSPERTVAIGSTTQTPTGAMIVHPETPYPSTPSLVERIDECSRAARNRWVDAGRLTELLFGDATALNIFVLGVAHQAGTLPVRAQSIEEAIELNGVAVARNLAAFRWGRRWVVDGDAVESAAAAAAHVRRPHDPTGASAGVRGDGTRPSVPSVGAGAPTGAGDGDGAAAVPGAHGAALPRSLAGAVADIPADDALRDLISRRGAELVEYQSAAYARRYLDGVTAVARAEQRAGHAPDAAGAGAVAMPSLTGVTGAAARNLFKLMAYKDEYEVARLLLSEDAVREAEAVAGPGATVVWQLHPPVLRSLGMHRKIALGPWARPVMQGLARAKAVRGTAVDPFGRAHVRTLERALISEYEAALRSLAEGLDADHLADATAIAELPDIVRGYEEIKLARAAQYREELARRLAAYRSR